MGSRLRTFVGALAKLAPTAPSIRARAQKVHMSGQNPTVSSTAIVDDQPTTTVEDTQAINAVESDQDPPQEGEAKPGVDDNSGPSEPSSPESPTHPSPFSGALSSPVDSSRSDSDRDEDAYGTYTMENDTIRDLRVKAFSPEDSRWTTKYDPPSLPVLHMRIVSWNVDFMADDTAGRVSCILDYLKKVVLTKHPQPSAILLQELDEASFAQILENRWVREHFAISPPNTRRWQASYGLATLVSRHARIESAQMLQFHHTRMGRAAILVDVSLRSADANANRGKKYVVRIANTHLESLPDGQPARPAQLCAIADMLRQPGIDAGIVGGDMNMIRPVDQRIHDLAGLHDAGTDGPESDTWGYQPVSRFPPGRLDRIFYTPSPELVVQPVKVIGKGLKTKRGQWASDHYGLLITITLRQNDDSHLSSDLST